MHRGARRAPIFTQEADYALFLETLGEAVERFGIEAHAYSLMPNHYHLLLCTPLGNLSRAMRHLNAVYTQRMNRLYAWDGPLFRGRFKSRLVSDEGYRRELIAYIHLNPVRAGLARRPEDPCWTSHRAHVELERPPSWLNLLGVREATGTPAQLHELVLTRQTGTEAWPHDMDLETGWRRTSPNHEPAMGDPPAPLEVLPMEHLLELMAEVLGTESAALRVGRKGRGAGPRRRFAALHLANLPYVSRRMVSEAFGMSEQQVSNLRYQAKQAPETPQTTQWKARWELCLKGESKKFQK